MTQSFIKSQRGFSLVELIVVIVLIGILGGIFAMQVLPAIRAYLAVGQRAAPCAGIGRGASAPGLRGPQCTNRRSQHPDCNLGAGCSGDHSL